MLDIQFSTIQVPFKEEFITELKFIMKFDEMTKTVRHRKSETSGSRQSIASSEVMSADRSEKSVRDKLHMNDDA